MQWPKPISWEAIRRRAAAGWAALRKRVSKDGIRAKLIRDGKRQPFLLLIALAALLACCAYGFYVRRPVTVPDILEMPPPNDTIWRPRAPGGGHMIVFATPHCGANAVIIEWDRASARADWGGGIARYADGVLPDDGGSWKLEHGKTNGQDYQILWWLDRPALAVPRLRLGEYVCGSAFFPGLDVLVTYNGHREGRDQFRALLNHIAFSESRRNSRELYDRKIVLPGMLELDPVPQTQLVFHTPSNSVWVLFRTEKLVRNRIVLWKSEDTPELTAEKWRVTKAGVTADNVERRTVNGADCEIVWKRTGAKDSSLRFGGIAYLTAQVFFPVQGLRIRYSGDWEGKETFLKALDSLKIASGADAKESPQ